MKSTVEELRAARARIDTPDKWWDGTAENADEAKSCAWLAFGVCSAYAAEDALVRVMGVAGRASIPAFNDSHTHAEVLAAFDRAIAVEEAREQEFTVAPEPVAVHA